MEPEATAGELHTHVFSLSLSLRICSSSSVVHTVSPSRGRDVAVYVFDINQPSLPTPFQSVLVSVSAFMALSSVFHSTNSLDNSSLSHFALPVLLLPYWSFLSLYESLLQP